MRRAEHVRAVAEPDGDKAAMGLLCMHCGAAETLRLPLGLSTVGGAMKGFLGEHEGCQVPDEPIRHRWLRNL